MKIIKATDYGFCIVVRVVMNPTDPEAVHVDGTPHIGTPTTAVVATFQAEFGRAPESWEWCPDCTYNWKEPTVDKNGASIPKGGFIWTGEELQVGLNKWGNPVHDEQKVVSVRDKTWDELYQEVAVKLDLLAVLDDVPRQAAPVRVPEAELAFELVAVGEPRMEDGLAKLRFKVLRLGVLKMSFVAVGEDKTGFGADRDVKYEAAQQSILDEEANDLAAVAIIR